MRRGPGCKLAATGTESSLLKNLPAIKGFVVIDFEINNNENADRTIVSLLNIKIYQLNIFIN